MKKILSALFIGIGVAFGMGSLALAADAIDPAVGTWKLNLVKSKFAADAAPKSKLRTYAQTAQSMSLKIVGVAPDGTPISIQTSYKFDGIDYPWTGTPGVDALSVTHVDASTLNYALKNNGKIVATGTRKVSADGQVLTISGSAANELEVYDKQ